MVGGWGVDNRHKVIWGGEATTQGVGRCSHINCSWASGHYLRCGASSPGGDGSGLIGAAREIKKQVLLACAARSLLSALGRADGSLCGCA
jgi:hypothetical protein